MSYSSIATCAADAEFFRRVQACAAQEGESTNPGSWASQYIWEICSSPEIAEAYSYALDQGTPHPGEDPGVISDAMILAHVQPIISPPQGMPVQPLPGGPDQSLPEEPEPEPEP